MMNPTTILLVDDHPMMRKGLLALLDQEENIQVVGEAVDGQDALDKVQQLGPEIVVMDINMPNLNGIDATRKILAVAPEAKILALSIHSGKHFVEEMLDAGAAGYLLKESAPEELVLAINTLGQSKGYLSAEITDIVLSRFRQGSKEGHARHGQLSEKIMAGKLQKPNLPAAMVHRKELFEKLQEGLEKKMTLVLSPAGYGKSTLVCDWLDRSVRKQAWLTLDKLDNELQLFLNSLVSAIRSIFPGACEQLLNLVNAANLPPISILSGTLMADLDKLDESFILVLDDMHLVSDKSINDFLSQVISHPLRSMHLVLIDRQDPFLPLEILRANADINELRMLDLCFSPQEITIFLERALGKRVDHDTVIEWSERTEGWVTGLQLAVRSLGSQEEAELAATRKDKPVNWRDVLTNREYEILLLLEQRLRDKEISEQLCVSTETVKSHLKNLYGKLHATDRRDAIVKAQQVGILN